MNLPINPSKFKTLCPPIVEGSEECSFSVYCFNFFKYNLENIDSLTEEIKHAKQRPPITAIWLCSCIWWWKINLEDKGGAWQFDSFLLYNRKKRAPKPATTYTGSKYHLSWCALGFFRIPKPAIKTFHWTKFFIIFHFFTNIPRVHFIQSGIAFHVVLKFIHF